MRAFKVQFFMVSGSMFTIYSRAVSGLKIVGKLIN